MADRTTGPRRSGSQINAPKDRSHADGRPVNLRVVQSDIRDAESLSTIEMESNGGDPYNSTGRFMVEKIRELSKED